MKNIFILESCYSEMIKPDYCMSDNNPTASYLEFIFATYTLDEIRIINDLGKLLKSEEKLNNFKNIKKINIKILYNYFHDRSKSAPTKISYKTREILKEVLGKNIQILVTYFPVYNLHAKFLFILKGESINKKKPVALIVPSKNFVLSSSQLDSTIHLDISKLNIDDMDSDLKSIFTHKNKNTSSSNTRFLKLKEDFFNTIYVDATDSNKILIRTSKEKERKDWISHHIKQNTFAFGPFIDKKKETFNGLKKDLKGLNTELKETKNVHAKIFYNKKFLICGSMNISDSALNKERFIEILVKTSITRLTFSNIEEKIELAKQQKETSHEDELDDEDELEDVDLNKSSSNWFIEAVYDSNARKIFIQSSVPIKIQKKGMELEFIKKEKDIISYSTHTSGITLQDFITVKPTNGGPNKSIPIYGLESAEQVREALLKDSVRKKGNPLGNSVREKHKVKKQETKNKVTKQDTRHLRQLALEDSIFSENIIVPQYIRKINIYKTFIQELKNLIKQQKPNEKQ